MCAGSKAIRTLSKFAWIYGGQHQQDRYLFYGKRSTIPNATSGFAA